MEAGSGEPQACDVCGRHMLSGERTREYVTPHDDRRAVCDLCRARANGAGWVRADLAERQGPREEEKARPRRRLRWRPRVKIVRERDTADHDGGRDRPGAEAQRRRPAVEHRPRPPETPERRIRRALERFNRSEHRRTVAGLTRSLGNPRVAAITPADAPDQVRLTVAWDLSWYQWEVELSEENTAVHSLGTGNEVSELGAADKAWNAWAGEDGRLQLQRAGNGDGDLTPPDDAG